MLRFFNNSDRYVKTFACVLSEFFVTKSLKLNISFDSHKKIKILRIEKGSKLFVGFLRLGPYHIWVQCQGFLHPLRDSIANKLSFRKMEWRIHTIGKFKQGYNNLFSILVYNKTSSAKRCMDCCSPYVTNTLN